MLKISEKLPDKSLFRRLHSIASTKDAVEEVSYTIIYAARRLNRKPLKSEKKLKIIQQYLQSLTSFNSLKVSLRKTKIMHWI